MPIDKPRATVDRQLQALHMLGVLECDEEDTEWAGRPATRWHYRLADGITPDALDTKSVPDLSVPTPTPLVRESENDVSDGGVHLPTDISGTDSQWPRCQACDASLCAGEHDLCAGCACLYGDMPDDLQEDS